MATFAVASNAGLARESTGSGSLFVETIKGTLMKRRPSNFMVRLLRFIIRVRPSLLLSGALARSSHAVVVSPSQGSLSSSSGWKTRHCELQANCFSWAEDDASAMLGTIDMTGAEVRIAVPHMCCITTSCRFYRRPCSPVSRLLAAD